MSLFRFVREALTITSIGILRCAGIQLQGTRLGHDEQVAQVGMARTAKVGMTEAHDGIVGMLIPSTVLVNASLIMTINAVRNGVGIGRQLHDAKGGTGSWEGVSHSLGADEGVHEIGSQGLGSCDSTYKQQEQCEAMFSHRV